jgi:hypothetical protein
MKMRENKGKIGCISGTGGLNRNTISFGVYSTDPPAPGLYDRFVPPAKYHAEIASVPRPTFATKPEGDCWLETYIVHHGGASAAPNASDPRGPNLAACVGRLVSNGHRFVANTPGSYNEDGERSLPPPSPPVSIAPEGGARLVGLRWPAVAC